MYELPRDHPLWRLKFDWLGIDRHGRVAVFSNVGYGPLPKTVNERLTTSMPRWSAPMNCL
jgi:hypothetical protein